VGWTRHSSGFFLQSLHDVVACQLTAKAVRGNLGWATLTVLLGLPDPKIEPVMPWSIDDQARFSSQVEDLLCENEDADDVTEQLIRLIEDTLLVYGVPLADQDVPTILGDVVRRVGSERWKEWAEEVSISHGMLLVLMIAAMVGMAINDEDSCEREREQKQRPEAMPGAERRSAPVAVRGPDAAPLERITRAGDAGLRIRYRLGTSQRLAADAGLQIAVVRSQLARCRSLLSESRLRITRGKDRWAAIDSCAA